MSYVAAFRHAVDLRSQSQDLILDVMCKAVGVSKTLILATIAKVQRG
jgi:hypothetical protein